MRIVCSLFTITSNAKSMSGRNQSFPRRSLSGAEPSVIQRPSFVNFISNWVASLSLYPIFLIFSLNMHNNMAQKLVQLWICCIAFMLLMIFFNYQKFIKFGIFEVCDHISDSSVFVSLPKGFHWIHMKLPLWLLELHIKNASNIGPPTIFLAVFHAK